MPANDYSGIPQTRNRTYIVAFKNEIIASAFKFPEPIELCKNIFDIIDRDIKQKDIYYYNDSEDAFYNYIVSRVKKKDAIYRVHDSGIHIAKNQTCPTLTASMGTRLNRVPIVVDNYGYRKLTIQECLDFQGFPNTFSFPNGTKIEEAYKQIGNSVCVPVVKRIAKEIKKVLENYYEV